MKKSFRLKLFYLIIPFLFSLNSFAQVSLGLTGGIIFPTKKDTDGLRPTSGFKVGIDFLVGSERWKFRTGLEYSSFRLISDPRSTDPYINYKTEYLGIPLGLRYIMKGKKINPFIEGSVNFMGNISHKNIEKSTKEYNPSSNTFFISPALGMGLLFNAKGKISLSFQINYAIQADYMLKEVRYKNESVNVRFNNLTSCVSIGCNF